MFSIHSNDLTSELARGLLTVHLVGMRANYPASASKRGFVHSDAFADYRSAASTKCFTLHLRPEPTRGRYPTPRSSSSRVAVLLLRLARRVQDKCLAAAAS